MNDAGFGLFYNERESEMFWRNLAVKAGNLRRESLSSVEMQELAEDEARYSRQASASLARQCQWSQLALFQE